MPETIGGILVSILGVGGGAAFIAYTLMKTLGAKWLDAQFGERLERFRHEKAKELEHLKSEIDGALKATIRLQEREFEVLAECWHLMNVSYGTAQSLTKPLQEIEDIGKMNEDMKKEFLDKFDFLGSVKQEILASHNPTKTFSESLFWLRYNHANEANVEFNNYVFTNEIFIEAQIAEEFKAVSKKISTALLNKRKDREGDILEPEDDPWKIISESCLPLLENLGVELRKKFFSQGVKLQNT